MTAPRKARQHATTKIAWSINGPERDAVALAQQSGGVAKQAKLMGNVVWCVAHRDGTTTVYLFPDEGRRMGLCMYRWCTRKANECGYHTGGRQERTNY